MLLRRPIARDTAALLFAGVGTLALYALGLIEAIAALYAGLVVIAPIACLGVTALLSATPARQLPESTDDNATDNP